MHLLSGHFRELWRKSSSVRPIGRPRPRASARCFRGSALLLLALVPGPSSLGAAVSQQGEQAPQLFTEDHPAMGTTFSLYLYARTRAEADADAELAFAEIDRVEDLLSNYRESSELSRINREAFASAVTTDPEMFRFLQTSLRWSAESDGAFDITVGHLMRTWGFFRAAGHVPTNAELAAVRESVGWQKVKLQPQGRTVRFLAQGVELDPGGIGKGYAIERAADLLRDCHVYAALLSAGSSTLYALGAPPHSTGWSVQVPTPGHTGQLVSHITLRDMSLSTANCSEKHFIASGHEYCHIMDPRTLRPVEGTLQVTVLDASATNSDALSNVLFVLGQTGSVPFLSKLQGNAALILSNKADAVSCTAFRWQGSLSPEICGKTAQGIPSNGS